MRFAEEGANVCIADIDEKKAKMTAAEVEESGGGATAVKTDVSNSKDVEEMTLRTINEFGAIDILVNNAGIKHISKLTETSEDLWNEVIAVNLTGVFLCCKVVLPYMIDRKKGKIINISSVHAYDARRNYAHYSASKGALETLTKSLALELAQYNIQVNSVVVGAIATELTPLDRQSKFLTAVPAGRIGTTGEIARLVTFLSSNECDYMTVTSITVDSGLTLGFCASRPDL